MTDGVSTAEAASRLKTTAPTVRSLLAIGELDGRKIPRGSRFAWLINASSIDKYLAQYGQFAGTRPASKSRLARLEQQVAALSDAPAGDGAREDALAPLQRERDDLRAKVVTLEDALARGRSAADLQRRADIERATMIEHLLAAVSAGERADALRRSAVAELHDALTSASQSGHLGLLGT